MTVAAKSVIDAVAESQRIRDHWSDAQRARRRKLGEIRRRKLLQLLQRTDNQQAA